MIRHDAECQQIHFVLDASYCNIVHCGNVVVFFPEQDVFFASFGADMVIVHGFFCVNKMKSIRVFQFYTFNSNKTDNFSHKCHIYNYLAMRMKIHRKNYPFPRRIQNATTESLWTSIILGRRMRLVRYVSVGPVSFRAKNASSL